MTFPTQFARLAGLIGIVCFAGSVSAAGADKDKPNIDKEATAPESAVVQDIRALGLAYNLVEYGDKKKDPYALVQAARMLKSIPTRQSSAKPKEGSVDTVEGESSYRVEAILNRAKDLALGRADVLSLIKDVEGYAARGNAEGPTRIVDAVRAGQTDVWEFTFVGGQRAGVVVSGDGDTDLDLYVHDQHGNLICGDDDYTDDTVCIWTPRWTGTFYVKIVNRGSVYNRYLLVTN